MEYLQMLLLLMPGKKIFFHILSEDIRGELSVDQEEIGRGSGKDREGIISRSGPDDD